MRISLADLMLFRAIRSSVSRILEVVQKLPIFAWWKPPQGCKGEVGVSLHPFCYEMDRQRLVLFDKSLSRGLTKIM